MFLKTYSKTYPSIIDASELARGGESVVYGVQHTGLDEIVAKCPLLPAEAKHEDVIRAYEGIFYESQTLKLNPKRDLVAEIKEELIEYNEEEGIITMYCVLVECAACTLQNVVDTWVDEKKDGGREKKREWFTPEKLAFYFFQAMSGISYMH
jgi:hypothetical protein